MNKTCFYIHVCISYTNITTVKHFVVSFLILVNNHVFICSKTTLKVSLKDFRKVMFLEQLSQMKVKDNLTIIICKEKYLLGCGRFANFNCGHYVFTGPCEDTLPTEDCLVKVDKGQCETHNENMEAKCYKSCGLCGKCFKYIDIFTFEWYQNSEGN